jgi:hypothetical protein
MAWADVSIPAQPTIYWLLCLENLTKNFDIFNKNVREIITN